MPVVTVASRPNGEPIATTDWPTWSESEEPMVAGVRPLTSSAWITAVSVSGSVPTIVALACEPSLNDTCSSPESPASVDDVVVGEDLPVGGQDDAGSRALALGDRPRRS